MSMPGSLVEDVILHPFDGRMVGLLLTISMLGLGWSGFTWLDAPKEISDFG
jgi:hypothetical protein